MIDRRTLLRGTSATALGAIALGSAAVGPAQAAAKTTSRTVGYGFQAITTTRPGMRDKVIKLLLKAPSLPHPDCVVFLIGQSTEDEDTVFITEGWTGREEHSRFFASAEAQAFVTKLQRLLTGESQYLAQLPVGGKAAF